MVRRTRTFALQRSVQAMLIGAFTAAMIIPLFGSPAQAAPQLVFGYDADQQVRFQYDKNNPEAGASYVETTGVTGGELVVPERVIDTSSADTPELRITRLGGDLSGYEGTFSRVVVPGSVESFDYRLFRRATVEELVLSEGITSVDARAFRDVGLQKLHLPMTLTSLGDEAFADNTLTALTVPASLETIGDSAFARNQLNELTLSPGLTRIGAAMFASNALTALTLPASITEIESAAFAHNYISAMVVGDHVQHIGSQAFLNNFISTLTITNPTVSLGEMVFGFNNLNELTLPDGLTSIPANAFIGNALLELTLPESVTTIGAGAFALNELRELSFSDSLSTIEDSAFLGNKLNKVTFGTGIHTIGPWAFAENMSLSQVEFTGAPPASISPGGDEEASLGEAGDLVVLFPRELTDLYTGAQRTTEWHGYRASPSVLWVSYETHGSKAIPREYVKYGRLMSLPRQPAKHGAIFTGWFSDAQLTTAVDPTQPITGDLTIHAGWKNVSAAASGTAQSGAQSNQSGLARTGTDQQPIAVVAVAAGLLLSAVTIVLARARRRSKHSR